MAVILVFANLKLGYGFLELLNRPRVDIIATVLLDGLTKDLKGQGVISLVQDFLLEHVIFYLSFSLRIRLHSIPFL
jgi:hypothetical protein